MLANQSDSSTASGVERPYNCAVAARRGYRHRIHASGTKIDAAMIQRATLITPSNGPANSATFIVRSDLTAIHRLASAIVIVPDARKIASRNPSTNRDRHMPLGRKTRAIIHAAE